MGYYDFDDHFWSPQEVCGKSAVPDEKKIFWTTQLTKLIRQFLSRTLTK